MLADARLSGSVSPTDGSIFDLVVRSFINARDKTPSQGGDQKSTGPPTRVVVWREGRCFLSPTRPSYRTKLGGKSPAFIHFV